MDTSRRASGYDLFKLIVAILLLILFLFLIRRTAPQTLAPESTGFPTSEIVSPNSSATIGANSTEISETSIPISHTPTAQPIESPDAIPEAETSTAIPSTPTSTVNPAIESTSTLLPSLTGTMAPSSTEIILTSTMTNLETPTATLLPSPTGTTVIESTPIPETPIAVITACEAASSRSRLQTGTNATILRRLNFRASPGIRDNWLRTNLPGTRVEIVGGPECLPHLAGAYVWWQIRLPDPGGEVGWSAEGSIHGTFYFMEPVE